METLSVDQRAALVRHGYDADLPARGVGGGPQRERVSWAAVPPASAWPGWPYLRNHICVLDGVRIDGHRFSDLDVVDLDTACLHCDMEWQDIPEDQKW